MSAPRDTFHPIRATEMEFPVLVEAVSAEAAGMPRVTFARVHGRSHASVWETARLRTHYGEAVCRVWKGRGSWAWRVDPVAGYVPFWPDDALRSRRAGSDVLAMTAALRCVRFELGGILGDEEADHA